MEESIDFDKAGRVNLTGMMPVINFMAQDLDDIVYFEFIVRQRNAFKFVSQKSLRPCNQTDYE